MTGLMTSAQYNMMLHQPWTAAVIHSLNLFQKIWKKKKFILEYCTEADIKKAMK